MAYDGQGQRTQLSVTPAGGSTTTTDFRAQGTAVVEESVAGVVTRSYVLDEAGGIVKLRLPQGQPDAGDYLVTWNGHGDALGLWFQNPDGTLSLANSYRYDSWGRPTTALHNGYPDLAFRFLYVGRSDVQWDDALGLDLHYMHARHYSPSLGRFLQPDPAAAEGNLYAYAENNPPTKVDPCGTWGANVLCGECGCSYINMTSIGSGFARFAIAVDVYHQPASNLDYAIRWWNFTSRRGGELRGYPRMGAGGTYFTTRTGWTGRGRVLATLWASVWVWYGPIPMYCWGSIPWDIEDVR